jgi:protein-S-isoprenylcysteine O-methyltransferase Ste14
VLKITGRDRAIVFGRLFFRLRGVTPIPLLVLSLIGAEFEPWLVTGGGLATVAGEGVRLSAIRHFGPAARSGVAGATRLVTTGPYARVRNPLYLANLLIYAGFAIASGAWPPWLQFATVSFFALQYGLIIHLEERTLGRLFGERYLAYVGNVPRLIPRWTTAGMTHPPFSLTAALAIESPTLLSLAACWLLLVARFVGA